MDETKGKVHILHDTALHYLKTKEKTPEETIFWLNKQGVTEEKSKIVVEKLQLQILRHKKAERVRTILSGLSLFTIGFLITFFYKGYIWWGAMIFGGMIFFRGLSMDID